MRGGNAEEKTLCDEKTFYSELLEFKFYIYSLSILSFGRDNNNMAIRKEIPLLIRLLVNLEAHNTIYT